MADIFERLIKNYGPIGQHRERAHGYFAFPKLEGEIGSKMKFRGQLFWFLILVVVHNLSILNN